MGGEGEGGEARFLVVGFLPRLVRPERMADTTDVCQVLVEGRAAVDLQLIHDVGECFVFCLFIYLLIFYRVRLFFEFG